VQLVIDPGGTVRVLYTEALDLSCLGRLQIRRASLIEPDALGRWYVDLQPAGGPCLGPFERRSQALAAETRWLEARLAALAPANAPRAQPAA